MEEKDEENKAAPRERVADGTRDGTQTRLLMCIWHLHPSFSEHPQFFTTEAERRLIIIQK